MQNNTFSGLFVGQNVIALQRVDSTNNYLKYELTKSEPLPEGTVIMAEEQYAGRGQFNNQWLSEPGKNLTFSLLLSPSFLDPAKQFLLNITVSIAINDVLTEIIGKDCKIKWPNDIFFGDKKLGGLLIENILSGRSWKHAIIGIGINVNQTAFADSIKNITSLKEIKGRPFDLRELLKRICIAIEKHYIQLKQGFHVLQHKKYLSRLYKFKELHTFEIDGQVKTGSIEGITEEGKLILNIEKELKYCGLKEVTYILP